MDDETLLQSVGQRESWSGKVLAFLQLEDIPSFSQLDSIEILSSDVGSLHDCLSSILKDWTLRFVFVLESCDLHEFASADDVRPKPHNLSAPGFKCCQTEGRSENPVRNSSFGKIADRAPGPFLEGILQGCETVRLECHVLSSSEAGAARCSKSS